MLPHVDELRPIHNLESMAELVRALSGATARARRSEGVAAEGGVMADIAVGSDRGQTG